MVYISGGVKFALDVGSERFEVNTPNHGIDYTNGQQHEVRMWRTGENGKVVHIQVNRGPISLLGQQPKFIQGDGGLSLIAKYLSHYRNIDF